MNKNKFPLTALQFSFSVLGTKQFVDVGNFQYNGSPVLPSGSLVFFIHFFQSEESFRINTPILKDCQTDTQRCTDGAHYNLLSKYWKHSILMLWV